MDYQTLFPNTSLMQAHQRSSMIGLDAKKTEIKQLLTSNLWQLHDQGQTIYRQAETIPYKNPENAHWLDIKYELALRHLKNCDFCVHNCKVDRTQNQQGYCQLGSDSPFSGAYLHWGEEPQIRPTWAVFLGGCTMHCAYCHNWRDTFDTRDQPLFDAETLIAQLQKQSQKDSDYRTLSFIGGTPEPHLHTLIACTLALTEYPELSAPLVFNSNATLSKVGLLLMEGIIDVYIPDYKHGNDTCAWNLTKIAKYTSTLQNNLRSYHEQKAGILIRHLPIPGHLECCTYPILKTLSQQFPKLAVNIMLEYQPMYKAEAMQQINRTLSAAEKQQINSWAQTLNLRVITP